MSYILEALKKSQAERQLGSAPSLHAVQAGAPLPAGRHGSDGVVRRRPLAIALGATAVAAAVAAGAWHFKSSERKMAAPRAVHTAVPVVAGPARASDAPLVVVPPSAPIEKPAIARAGPAPAPAAPAFKVGPAQAPAVSPLAVVPPLAPAEKPPAARAAPAPVKAAAPPAPSPAADVDETLQTLRYLPESIQRAVPALVFGGYMYSSNPADRLVLIDKTLRHEGEEIAPGLVLEKLLPKAAVMNYRGYRYRVPF